MIDQEELSEYVDIRKTVKDLERNIRSLRGKLDAVESRIINGELIEDGLLTIILGFKKGRVSWASEARKRLPIDVLTEIEKNVPMVPTVDVVEKIMVPMTREEVQTREEND